ncbi:MAG: GNAT family N-acetyltransferase [Anaerolineae bacterium]
MKTLVQQLEELSFRAWPALETRYYDGWVLRFSQGYTRRANSVNPIYESAEPLAEKIRACEDLYLRHDLPTVFKITPASQPRHLDTALSEHGYIKDGRVFVQQMALSDVDAQISADAHIDDAPSETWLNNYFRLNGTDRRHYNTMREMLKTIVPQTAFLSLHHKGSVIAVGLAVHDEGYIGLYDIVTDAPQRGRGHGHALMQSLLAWGKMQGAHHAYLQVSADNAPALRLYDHLGFREVYQYWYRQQKG